MAIKLTGNKEFDMFWAAWAKHVGKLTDKGDAEVEFKKAIKSEEDKDRFIFDVVGAVESQARYKERAQGMGKFVPEFKSPHRWIKSRKWRDEMPSLESLSRSEKYKREEKFCACGQPVVVLSLNVCERCWTDKYTNSRKVLYDNLVKRGMGKKKDESKQEYIGRIKNALGVQEGKSDLLQGYLDAATTRNKG